MANLTSFLFYTVATLLAIVTLIFIFLWQKYNQFVILKNQVKTDFADIDVQLKRRASLIERLAGMVREYATHEEKTMTQVAKARSMIDSSKTAQDAAKAENFLTQTLRSLAMVVEAYPKLQANDGYLELQKELQGTENKVATYRESYNMTVLDYNNQVQTFPNLIAATIFQFKPESLFTAQDDSSQ